MKIILFDTETTGVEDSDRIVELAWGLYDMDRKDSFVHGLTTIKRKPPVPIGIKAMSVHGITPEEVENLPEFSKDDPTINYFVKLIEDQNNYIVAHNIHFDISMLNKEGIEVGAKIIDTLRVSKHILEDLEAYNLQYLYYYFGLYKFRKETDAHSAGGDVDTLGHVFGALIKIIEENDISVLSKMVKLTEIPVLLKRIDFGKHKGRLYSEIIDKSYFSWCLNNMENLDEDKRYTFNHYLKG